MEVGVGIKIFCNFLMGYEMFLPLFDGVCFFLTITILSRIFTVSTAYIFGTLPFANFAMHVAQTLLNTVSFFTLDVAHNSHYPPLLTP